jgi:SAM-dependent methyltransferase
MTQTLAEEDAYGAGAEGYTRVLDPWLEPMLARLVELAAVGPGGRVLDLATGTGAAARLAARQGASVVGVDASPGMIALARRNSPPSIRFEVAEAERLPFDSAAFTLVTCSLGLSHFPEPEAALAEVIRVLAPGGLLAACSWGAEWSNPANDIADQLLDKVAPRDPFPRGAVNEPTWRDADGSAAVLRSAGFAAVSVRTEVFAGAYRDADDALAWAIGWPGPVRRLGRLDPEVRQRYRRKARVAIEAAGDLSWRFTANYHLAVTGAAAEVEPRRSTT